LFNGSRFEFVQDPFDLLCSDLRGVSLASAVVASSAVPMLPSPITLWMHSGASPDCGDPPLRHGSSHAKTSDAAALRRTALALADIPINRNSALTLAHQRAMLQAWEASASP
jgi:NTE family protein